MGRPLNKRLFTDAATGATAGASEIKVNFNSGGGVKEGTIIKQVATKKFKVAETGAADDVFTCTLTTGKLPSALASGEMSISVQGNDGETYTVSKISGRTMTLKAIGTGGNNKNELDGFKVQWGYDAAANAPDATQRAKTQIEEAGADDVAGNDEDNFADA